MAAFAQHCSSMVQFFNSNQQPQHKVFTLQKLTGNPET